MGQSNQPLLVTQASHDNQSTYIRLTFTQGFLFGQLSLVIVVILFIKYVVFEDPETARNNRRQKRPRRTSLLSPSRRRQASYSDRNVNLLVPEVLSKLSYDLSTHPPETADWLNVLVAQAIVAYRSLVHGELDVDDSVAKGDKARQMVEEALNFGRDGEPGFISVDYITVTEVDFGDQFPLCTNARVRPADETGRMRIEVDVDYSDHVTLAIETKVVINFPTSRFAVLPVSLGLTLNQLSATIMAEIPPVAIPLPVNHDPAAPSPAILLSLDPDFTLSMSTTSLLGSRAKLQDIPKVEQLILGRLRAWMVDNFVWPKVRVLKLPGVGSKGAIEHAENGAGEYVWVESEPIPAEEAKAGSPSNLAPEADEDTLSLSQTLLPPINVQQPTPINYAGTQLPDSSSHMPRSVRYRSNSTSSRPLATRPPGHLSSEFATPPRLGHLEKLESQVPAHKTSVGTDDASSSRAFSQPPRSAALRHSTSMMPNTTHIYRTAFANHALESREDIAAQTDDPDRWAQASGIWGLSLGLNNGVSTNASYGIRERLKEAERMRASQSPTKNSGNVFRE